jgi:cyclopropane-fatty-acyl-phospholipid synthase
MIKCTGDSRVAELRIRAVASIITNKNTKKHDRSYRKAKELLSLAGVTINGGMPWDIHVHDERFYARVIAKGSLGFGESYMDGWWDCDELDSLFYRLFTAGIPARVVNWADYLAILQAIIVNLQNGSRAVEIIKRHYDIDNDLYRAMLDQRMVYSCGYWKQAKDLDAAQEAKLDLVCKKLFLEPGMRVLDIGCGWGGAARFMAERYQVEVVGVTISEQQAIIANEQCTGFPVEIRLQDYKGIEGRFDRIFSLGMFEHVGCKNYPVYMQYVADHLADDGLFLLHTIGANYTDSIGNAWVEKYIFPNSMLASVAQVGKAAENKLVMEDWQNFGSDYDKTLMAWFDNFHAQWPEIGRRYDQRFYRMWKLYLLSFAGSFRARENQLWQVVFSRPRRRQRYDAVR